MLNRLLSLLTLLGLPLLILISVNNSSAALLTVLSASQNISAIDETYNAEALKPAACDSIFLDNNIITGNGAFSDTSGHKSLLIGTETANSIDGLDSDDCIVANDGNDTLEGDAGTDVCLGGNGDDEFSDCETCDGGSGTDTDLTATCTIRNSVELP
jgi:Ca2+-binding RTX toxin-like protein